MRAGQARVLGPRSMRQRSAAGVRPSTGPPRAGPAAGRRPGLGRDPFLGGGAVLFRPDAGEVAILLEVALIGGGGLDDQGQSVVEGYFLESLHWGASRLELGWGYGGGVRLWVLVWGMAGVRRLAPVAVHCRVDLAVAVEAAYLGDVEAVGQASLVWANLLDGLGVAAAGAAVAAEADVSDDVEADAGAGAVDRSPLLGALHQLGVDFDHVPGVGDAEAG